MFSNSLLELIHFLFMNPKQRKSVALTMFGNQRKKLHKLSQISPRFSREIGDSLRRKLKYS